MAELTSSPSRLFEIPELLQQIFALVAVSDCARLASTSQAIFGATIPRVWTEVHGVDKLLLLMLEAPPQDHQKETPGTTVLFMPPLSTADFTRLELYAPLVKTLSINHEQHSFVPSPWRTLLVRARQAPILPNLVSLKFNGAAKHDEQILWLHVFASASIRSITTAQPGLPQAPQISIAGASVVLKHLGQTCPALNHLEILPGFTDPQENGNDEFDGEHPFISILWDASYDVHLRNLTSLTRFSTNTSVLTPEGILALASLPKLVHLEVSSTISGDEAEYGIQPNALPDGSFPSLRELSLHYVTLLDIWSIWHTEALVKGLTNLTIKLAFPDNPDTGLPSIDWFIFACFPTICARSTQLESISLDFGGLDRTWIAHDYGFQLYIPTARLSHLQRVSVYRLIGGRGDQPFLAVLGTIWPHLKELNVPDYFATLETMQSFAMIPKLEQLVVCLSSMNRGWNIPPIESLPPAKSNNFRKLGLFSKGLSTQLTMPGGSQEPLDAKDFARYLCALWPSIEEVEWYEGVPEGPLLDLGKLNGYISEFRVQSETPVDVAGRMNSLVLGD